MPRLDNSSEVVTDYIWPGNPGELEPLDFCFDCWSDMVANPELPFQVKDYEVDHPSYGGVGIEYDCFECGKLLIEADD